jgi:hypothetical protein
VVREISPQKKVNREGRAVCQEFVNSLQPFGTQFHLVLLREARATGANCVTTLGRMAAARECGGPEGRADLEASHEK